MAVGRRIVIHGRVQGVGFRDAVRRRAKQLDVSGWVSNRVDGGVDVTAEGESDAVNSLLEFCRTGPRGAFVEEVHVADEHEPEGLSGFDVRG